MAHSLNLFIDECEGDCRVLKITDISLYDDALAISNSTLKIRLPGNSSSFIVPFPVKGTGYYTLTSFGGGINTCETPIASLPDGLYEVTYYVDPEATTKISKKFFRTCNTKCMIYSKLSAILESCDKIIDCNGNDITDKTIRNYKDMLILLDAAKADVKMHKDVAACNKLDYVISKLI